MKIQSLVPHNTCCDMRDSWNVISKLSSDFGVVIHGPGGCENEFLFKNTTDSAMSFSTKLSEIDIIMGSGYEKLFKTVENIIDNHKKIKIIYILGTCSSELIGEDIDNIVNSFKKSNVKIIPIHTSGMRGSGYNYTKYNIFLSLFDQFTDINVSKTNIVNIFFQDGMQNDKFRKEIETILELFSIKVNSFFNSNLSYQNIKNLGTVSMNYLIGNDSDFISILNQINDKHNIPFKILALPIGVTNINKFYSEIFFDFFEDKNRYVIEFLKQKQHKLKEINKLFLNKLNDKYNFFTNSQEYKVLLEDFGIGSIKFEEDYLKVESKNTSHKFNYSNKIIISEMNNLKNSSKLYSNNIFSSSNKYMGLVGMTEFYNDLLNQISYINFVNRYNKYI